MSVTVDHLPTRYGAASISWRTRHSDEGFTALVPRELWVEVQGEAPDLESARNELAELGRATTPILALSANAAIEDPEIEVAYDATPGTQSREFFQSMRRTEMDTPSPSRVLRSESVGPLIDAIFGSPENARLHRSVVQYGEALKAWRPGSQLRCCLHLWMAVEALTKAAERIETTRLGTDRPGLLAAWGIDIKELDATTRKRLIFHGDASTYSELRELSDAIEHSFEDLAPLHARAEAIRATAARHIRRAILELAGLPTDLTTTLTSSPFDDPKETFGLSRYLRARLVGNGDELAIPGQPHPFVHMQSTLTDFDLNEDGSYRVTRSETYTAALGPGIVLADPRVELWGPPETVASVIASDHAARGGRPVGDDR